MCVCVCVCVCLVACMLECGIVQGWSSGNYLFSACKFWQLLILFLETSGNHLFCVPVCLFACV